MVLEMQNREFNKGFDSGILVALQVLHLYDQPVIAKELIDTCCNWKELKILSTGNDVDVDTIEWLKINCGDK